MLTDTLTVGELRLHPPLRSEGVEAHPDGTVTLRAGGLRKVPGPVPDGGVTARLLRRLPLGEIVETALHGTDGLGGLRELADHYRPLQRGPRGDGPPLFDLSGWDERLDARRRPGRRGRPDQDYLPLVAAYVDRVASGDPTPVATLAGERYLSQSRVRNLLHEARRRDLLTRGAPGRAGGALTEKARRLLDEEAERKQ